MTIVCGYDREVLNKNNLLLRVPNSRQDCGIKLNTKPCVHDAKSMYHQRKSMGVTDSIWYDVFVHYKY